MLIDGAMRFIDAFRCLPAYEALFFMMLLLLRCHFRCYAAFADTMLILIIDMPRYTRHAYALIRAFSIR